MNTAQTENKLALFILTLSCAIGGVLAFVLLQMGFPVHTSALAAPHEQDQVVVLDLDHQDSPAKVMAALPPGGERLMVPLRSFVVALNEPGEPRYLKITIAVEAASQALQNEVEARSAEIRDSLIPYFSSLSLALTRGIRGKQQIRRKARQLINAMLTNGQIERIFIFEFITQ